MHILHRFLRPGRVSVSEDFYKQITISAKPVKKKHVATKEVKNNQFYPHTSLVGGIPTPLKNRKVSWDDEIPSIWKNVPNHQSVLSLNYHYKFPITLWLLDIAMETHILFSQKMGTSSIYGSCSIAMLNNQMVYKFPMAHV